MDRIAALRTVEESLRAFEDGELDLDTLEERVRATLRTYATEFEGELAAYRATGGRADGMVVVATSEREAHERVTELLGKDGGDGGNLTVERME